MSDSGPIEELTARLALDEVIVTDELRRRGSRAPDHERENRALTALVGEMARGDEGVLQRLVEAALDLCRAHSAGVSILEEDGGDEVFRWHAIAGAWAGFMGETMPREASPCGTVLDRDRTLLMARPERRFAYDLDGAPPIVETLLVPFRVAGEPLGTVWIIAHDETRRFDGEDERLLESLASCAATVYQLSEAEAAARRSSHAKTSFLSTMSHELRNPLNVITGYADLLHDGVLGEVTDRQREALDRTKKTASHLVKIIDEILIFTQADNGHQELRVDRIDLADITRDVVAMYAGEADRRGLQLRRIGLDEPVTTLSDEGKVRHILSNLVGNAVKYTEEGVVEVELTAEAEAVEVHVRDSGPGIPADRLDDIFRPFERVEVFSNADPQEGTGLGLAIARRMARVLEGDVLVESTRGKGSAFTLRLPRRARPVEAD